MALPVARLSVGVVLYRTQGIIVTNCSSLRPNHSFNTDAPLARRFAASARGPPVNLVR